MAQTKFNTDGSVVEDTFQSKNDASIPTEVYLWQSLLKDFQYSFRNAIEGSDDDANEYIEFLKDLSVNGNAPGAIQAKATDFTTDEYIEATGLGGAIEMADPSEIEMNLTENGGLLDALSDRNQKLVSENTLRVPVTPDGEAMPLFVASDERVAGVHNLEEAKEMWESFLGHYDVVEMDSDAINQSDSDSDSDQPDVLLGGATGVGPDVSENIREFITSERVMVDWREHVDGDSDEWRTTVTPESEETDSESDEPELSSAEVRDQYLAVKDDLSEFDEEIVQQRIIDGDLQDAMSIIEDAE